MSKVQPSRNHNTGGGNKPRPKLTKTIATGAATAAGRLPSTNNNTAKRMVETEEENIDRSNSAVADDHQRVMKIILDHRFDSRGEALFEIEWWNEPTTTWEGLGLVRKQKWKLQLYMASLSRRQIKVLVRAHPPLKRIIIHTV